MITVQHNDAPLELELYTDGARHLICVPYSEVNLHQTHGEGSFDNLPTRKRNSLARDQMFHQEYHDLARAIMGK